MMQYNNNGIYFELIVESFKGPSLLRIESK